MQKRANRLAIALALASLSIAVLALSVTYVSAQRRASPLSSTSVPTIVSYQGRLTASGSPFAGIGFFKFAVVSSGGSATYWSNDGTSVGGSQPSASVPVSVSAGLFTVMLGDTSIGGMSSALSASVFSTPDRRLRIWFSANAISFTQLGPDQQIASVPFALNAETLDGLHGTDFAAAQHEHSSADISDTIPASKIDLAIARTSQITPTVANAGFITKTQADLMYAQRLHTHSGGDIVLGTVSEPRIDPLIARQSQITATVANAGFITQTAADARYARLSPNSLQIEELKWYVASTAPISFAVGSGPFGVAFDGANMWVTNISSNSISVLHASDGALVRTISLGASPRGIAYDGANMWVANFGTNRVNVLRAIDGVPVMTITVGVGPYGMAFDGTNMWVSNSSDNTASAIRVADGVIVGTYPTGSGPRNLAFDGTNMWITNDGSDSVTVIHASDGFPVGTYAVGHFPRGIVFDGQNMWIANDAGSPSSVSVLRAADGALINTIPIGGNPYGIGFDGANIWVGNAATTAVKLLKASDGTLVKTVPVSGGAFGFAFDGANMWIASNGDNTVAKR